MLLIESKETCISVDVVIACPKVDFKSIRALVYCTKCEFYNGLGVMRKNKFKEVQNIEGVFEMSSSELEDWSLKYAIRCSHIIERRTSLIPKVIE